MAASGTGIGRTFGIVTVRVHRLNGRLVGTRYAVARPGDHGLVSVTLPKLPVGKYRMVTSFGGNAYVNAKGLTTRLTVTRR